MAAELTSDEAMTELVRETERLGLYEENRVIHAPDYWLERMRSLMDRALAYGPSDWTVDFKTIAADVLEEFREEYGSYGTAECCNHRGKFARPTNVPGSDDDRIRVCRDCDGESKLRIAS